MSHSDPQDALARPAEAGKLQAWMILPKSSARDLLAESLECLSCEVVTFADFRTAAEQLHQGSPDLVLLSECELEEAGQLDQTWRETGDQSAGLVVVVTADLGRFAPAAWADLGVNGVLETPATSQAAHIRLAPFCQIIRLKQQLREAEQRAESASRTKTEFLRNINHELRTPMTSIQGIAEMLLDDEDIAHVSANHVSSLQSLIEHAKELTQRVDNILGLSRLEGGAMEIRLRNVSPIDILNTIQKDFRRLAQSKGLDFSMTVCGAVPHAILTDADCLKEVLRHVVGNAVKFTSQGQVAIRSRVLAKLSRPLWQLEIRDTGIGIPAEKLGILFRPFVQADMSPSRDHGGIGVGLAISKRLIQMLGGSVQVHSTEGAGTTISLTIETGPLDSVEMLDETEAMSLLNHPPIPVVPAQPAARNLRGRILLAEDAVANQRILAAMLRKAGAEVDVVENGQLAADAALDAVDKGHPFDLILMDMQMPVLDGYHATSLLRSHGYQFPIVALTAHTFAGERESCLAVGCDDYLTKPVERESFISFVSKYCGADSREPVAAYAGSS